MYTTFPSSRSRLALVNGLPACDVSVSAVQRLFLQPCACTAAKNLLDRTAFKVQSENGAHALGFLIVDDQRASAGRHVNSACRTPARWALDSPNSPCL